MSYKKITGFYTNKSGHDQIAYYLYKPKEKPIAILQLSHGMCEYIERYERLIEFLTAKGILVCGNDHLGHGKTARSKMVLGNFGSDEGNVYMTEDLKTLSNIVKKEFPITPYYLLGNGMGSLIARIYITKYGEDLDGTILIGTSGNNYLSKAGIKMSKKKRSGNTFRSDKTQQLIYGYLNNQIANAKTKFDWLSRDESRIEAFIKDEYCNFTVPTNGLETLFLLLEQATSLNWASLVPSNLPVLLLSGQEDPVGDYGEGATKVLLALKNSCVEDVRLTIYPDARHDILNELNFVEVYDDIYQWIKKQLPCDDFYVEEEKDNFFKLLR